MRFVLGMLAVVACDGAGETDLPGSVLTIHGEGWRTSSELFLSVVDDTDEIVARTEADVDSGDWTAEIGGLEDGSYLVYLYEMADNDQCDRGNSWIIHSEVAGDTEQTVAKDQTSRDGMPCTHL